MERLVGVSLNKFSVIPHSLRISGSANVPVDELFVNLARLYHHYYLDTYGCTPPNPDPAQFEYLRFLSKTQDFKIIGEGLGMSTASRRHRSTELGQAFCRWFLHDHMNITYFAHMSQILDKQLHPGFGNLQVNRKTAGDAPDYFCAESVFKVFLAEAKGRYTSVSFSNREFDSWRRQFERVVIQDRNGKKTLSIKGFVVATRFATEAHSPSIQTRVYAEDPTTPGEREFSGQEYSGVGSAIIALHYGRLVEKLGQPILAASLTEGFLVPDEIRFPVVVWECLIPPLKGKRFIGGYHIPPNTAQTVKWEKDYSFLLIRRPFQSFKAILNFFRS